MSQTRVSLLVTGRVQGVGFRYFCLQVAKSFKLFGYARNLPDGSVEIIAEGDKVLLEEFAQEIKQGPKFAQISNLNIKWSEPDGEFSYFEIK